MRGASIASTAKQAAAKADIVLCMVTDHHASRAMWMGEKGALAGLKPGTILIESSTPSIPWVKELAFAAAGQNCHFLDAPVTGSKADAEAGKLLFLVGGRGQA
ncbi:MAG: NAD(P)-binding domain-containing protein [Terriglobia bacterium]